MPKTRYCVGFAFSAAEDIVLIQKNKPEWQKGLLNGVGGHVEDGESVIDAMVREFEKETGVVIPASDWELYCHLEYEKAAVSFYRTFSDDPIPVKTITLEKVLTLPLKNFQYGRCVENLRWLIPLALDTQYTFKGEINNE